MSTNSIALLVLVALTVFWSVGGYNRLARLKNAISDAFNGVDFQFKDRLDLLLKLTEAAAEYLHHEPSTLTALLQARSVSSTAQDAVRARPSHAKLIQELMGAEQQLNDKLNKLWAVSTHNLSMLADPKVRELAQQLITTQSKLAFGCQSFNASVGLFNAARRQFPTLLIARLFGFTAAAELTVGADTLL
ncbi:MAG: LemA family protein [Polaromonas sp.]